MEIFSKIMCRKLQPLILIKFDELKCLGKYYTCYGYLLMQTMDPQSQKACKLGNGSVNRVILKAWFYALITNVTPYMSNVK